MNRGQALKKLEQTCRDNPTRIFYLEYYPDNPNPCDILPESEYHAAGNPDALIASAAYYPADPTSAYTHSMYAIEHYNY